MAFQLLEICIRLSRMSASIPFRSLFFLRAVPMATNPRRILAYVGLVVGVLLLSELIGRTRWTIGRFEQSDIDIGRLACTLTDTRITESSGIVRSDKNPDCFWTHNDSGDYPRIFLVHSSGKTIATVTVKNAKAIDWEDIAIGQVSGKSILILGDIGGNAQKRNDVVLYVVEEPVFDIETALKQEPSALTVPILQTTKVQIPGGITNYEAIAMSPDDQTMIIVEKALLGGRAFSFPLLGPTSELQQDRQVQATLIGNTPVPYATACDIASDGRSMVLTTYGTGFLYKREPLTDNHLETWEKALQREPVVFRLPKLKQIEAVCFSANAKSIFITSEQLPTPLVEMDLPLDVELDSSSRR